MPGEIPTSPTTAPPVQVTAVPPRTAKLAADPSDWADADETPPSSAAVASRHPARYLFRLIMICIPNKSFKKSSEVFDTGRRNRDYPPAPQELLSGSGPTRKDKGRLATPFLSCCHGGQRTTARTSRGNSAARLRARRVDLLVHWC